MFPLDIQALVWNIGGSVSILVILYMLIWDKKSYSLIPVAAWWTYEELLVIAASIIRCIDREKQPEQYSTISFYLNFPLGLISVSICAALAVLIYKENKRAANSRP